MEVTAERLRMTGQSLDYRGMRRGGEREGGEREGQRHRDRKTLEFIRGKLSSGSASAITWAEC